MTVRVDDDQIDLMWFPNHLILLLSYQAMCLTAIDETFLLAYASELGYGNLNFFL